MKYIDTHGHLNSKEFRDDYKKYIDEAKEVGVFKIVVPGTNHEDSLEAIKIASENENVFALAALHPTDGYKVEDIDWLETIDGSKLVGVGECGIDLYREENPELKVQEEIFRRHIRYAMKWDIPVIIHSRDAEQETFNIVTEEEFKEARFVIHCNTMNKEWVTKFVSIGAHISFSGIVTFKNAKDIKEAMLSVPLDKLLVETDSPYLAPTPMRGKMNKPEFVKYTAEFVAEERKEPREEVLEALVNNAERFFSI